MDYKKSIDEYKLYKLVPATMQAADLPCIQEIRQQLLMVLAIHCNFRQCFPDNISILQAHIVQIAVYEIIVREDWGLEIKTTMGKIHLVYGYEYVHAANSITVILKELVAAKAVCDIMVPPTPTNNKCNNMLGQDHILSFTMTHVCHLVFHDDITVGTATVVGDKSDSSGESDRKSHACRSGNRQKLKSLDYSKSDSREEQTAANNLCKYCKRHGRRNHHPNVPAEQYFWNKKLTGIQLRAQICATF